MFKWVKEYSGVITMLAMFLMFIATMWFRVQTSELLQNYTPLTQTTKLEEMVVQGFAQNTKDHAQITAAVTGIEKSLALISQNTVMLQDHEARIRMISERQIDVLARLKALELLHPAPVK